MTFIRPALMALLAVGLSFGCASVNRIDTETVTDLSGDWNDTDSRLVAEEMITDALTFGWIGEFTAKKGSKPKVIVGTIRNRSHEHINTQTFVKDLERQFVRSGRAGLVSSKTERGEIREERDSQQENASVETARELRNETGADYMLIGEINTIMDSKGGKTAKFYQVNLELHDMESTEKVWIGEKKIKKMIKRGMFGG